MGEKLHGFDLDTARRVLVATRVVERTPSPRGGRATYGKDMASPDAPVWARLTSRSGDAYTWTEVLRATSGAYASHASPLSGTLNAYELNGRSANIDSGNAAATGKTHQVLLHFGGRNADGSLWWYFDVGATDEASEQREAIVASCPAEETAVGI